MRYAICNVLDKTQRGWVNALVEETNQSICYNTTVSLLEQNDDFELVKVIDGSFIGKIARVPYKKKSNGHRISYLEEDKKVSYNNLVISYNLKRQELDILGLKLKAIHNGALSIGTYRLLIPKYPHDKSKKYTDESNNGTRFAETWFQIQASTKSLGEFFLHFGTVTDGCVTVVDSGKKWTKTYLILMQSRIDSKSIAWLKIF